ncbi:MAG TPA: 50S ribosomal protein L32 [Anaeromyxobacteraceae bacterium]|nr:50S ribosomal protein L32 [Anaeromyxobacteraceae bacterium]
MGVPKKRTSSMRRNRRRAANFKIKPANVTLCPKCKEPVMSHRVCPSCGFYKDKQVTEGA